MFLGVVLGKTSLTRWRPLVRGLASAAAVFVSALLAGSLSLIDSQPVAVG